MAKRIYTDEQKARLKAQQHEHYMENKEAYKEKRLEYYAKNKEKILKSRKKYYQANKESVKTRVKQYRKTHIDRYKECGRRYNSLYVIKQRRREYDLGILYGASTEEWNALHAKQQGLCAICGKTLVAGKDTTTDHCHKTGIVRGLLCANCNKGIGMFGDDPERLLKAYMYLMDFESEAGNVS